MRSNEGALSETFDVAAARAETRDLVFFLQSRKISEESIDVLLKILAQLQLPLPHKDEFFGGTEGALLFINTCGVVIRIEGNNWQKPEWKFDRIEDHPFVLRPLGVIETADARIEICPGCHTMGGYGGVPTDLSRNLRHTGVEYWDSGSDNTGYLPFSTPKFPQGIPVVIDRLAVRKLSDSIKTVAEILKECELTEDPQEMLYGGLRHAFDEAWPQSSAAPDPEKMRCFWEACRKAARRGELVDGWNKGGGIGAIMAAEAADKYRKRFLK